MRNQRKVTWIKLGLAGLLLCINISVYTIWIPARLQISETYIHINEVWDRVEKGIFLVVDAGLNIYFIYLVRSKLISNGLTKYFRLYHFNIAMILCSISLDVSHILSSIALLFTDPLCMTGHPYRCYVSSERLHLLAVPPLRISNQLYIELNVTELMAKIVRLDEAGSDPSDSNGGTGRKSNARGTNTGIRGIRMGTLITANREFSELHEHNVPATGIQKTVETEVRYITKGTDDGGSQASSTEELRNFYNV